MKPVKYFLLAGSVPLLAALITVGSAPKYLLPNLVFYALPQMFWWVFCVIWWACRKPPENRGLFFGGIGAADLLLLYLAFTNGESERWLLYLEAAPVAAVIGGLAVRFCAKTPPGAPPSLS
jgi:hypothetical protein